MTARRTRFLDPHRRDAIAQLRDSLQALRLMGSDMLPVALDDAEFAQVEAALLDSVDDAVTQLVHRAVTTRAA